MSGEPGAGILSQAGPSLLRFSVVEWTEDEKTSERRLALVDTGLDYVLNWGARWRQPANAYAAYMASVFASAGSSSGHGLRESVTGFVAQWFAQHSAAAIAHFELHENVIRFDAQTVRACVLEETSVLLPVGWQTALEEFHQA